MVSGFSGGVPPKYSRPSAGFYGREELLRRREAAKREMATKYTRKEEPEEETCLCRWDGEDMRFPRVFRGHRFTDAEVDALIHGEEIEVHNLSHRPGGTLYAVRGKLQLSGTSRYKTLSFKSIDIVTNRPGYVFERDHVSRKPEEPVFTPVMEEPDPILVEEIREQKAQEQEMLHDVSDKQALLEDMFIHPDRYEGIDVHAEIARLGREIEAAYEKEEPPQADPVSEEIPVMPALQEASPTADPDSLAMKSYSTLFAEMTRGEQLGKSPEDVERDAEGHAIEIPEVMQPFANLLDGMIGTVFESPYNDDFYPGDTSARVFGADSPEGIWPEEDDEDDADTYYFDEPKYEED